MRYAIVLCAILALAIPAAALNTGTDILVPAAGRNGVWVTDLYILNPGNESTNVSVFWLLRNQRNLNPSQRAFLLSPGQTLALEDVISSTFGLSSGDGAFRVTSDHEVLVSSRIYSINGDGSSGQGFEGTPLDMAISSGEGSDVVGLSENESFRTNVFGCAGEDGATLEFALRSLEGTEIATATKSLREWEPFLQKVNELLGSGTFDNASLRVHVSAGSAIIGASKIDNTSIDPTTLEASMQCRGGAGEVVHGNYQMSFFDLENYASGGQITIENGQVTLLNATYTNWDKVDAQGIPSCKWIFKFGSSLVGNPSLEELEDGIEIVSDYASENLGLITYTLKLTASGNGFVGSLDAVGSSFPADVAGCNGSFPQQRVFVGVLPLP